MSRWTVVVAAVLLISRPVVLAGDDDDGLKQGEAIGVFYVTKVAGAEDDGVEPGEELCYRCRYGSSPMVMVFARQTGGKIPTLAKELDSAVGAHEEVRFKGLLTLLGEDTAELEDRAKRVAEEVGIKRVPVVIAKESKTGPLNYKLPPKAEVTIVVAKDSQVVTTHVSAAAQIDVPKLMREISALLSDS